MSPLNDRQTLAHLVRVCAAGSLSALFLATPLWMGTREEVPRFPLTEAFVSVERPIFFTLFVALGALLLIPFSRALLVLVCVCFSALVAGDVIRLHPWVLQCTLLFGVSACLLGRTREKNLLGFFALVVGGIYFWSGINKLNYGFVAGEFPVLLGPSSESLPPELIAVTGLCAAVFEMIAGGLLLIGGATFRRGCSDVYASLYPYRDRPAWSQLQSDGLAVERDDDRPPGSPLLPGYSRVCVVELLEPDARRSSFFHSCDSSICSPAGFISGVS
jgi:hypothetical protein